MIHRAPGMSEAATKSGLADQPATLAHPAAIWGVFGFVLILGQALYRLTPLALEPIQSGELLWWQWGLYGVSMLFNGYSEGYKAFQLQVAPRVVARANHLAKEPRLLHVLFAPLFCMCLFHATKKRLIVSWSVYVGIIALIILVRQLPQPYRGIVDAGVVLGLSWGVVAIVATYVQGLRGHLPDASPCLPE